ncbi:TetR/AcrR family transcriptional regulator C-terminal domain-containing protein [Agromyces mediolanus]|uniref:TetR/AcrR family transcriptional regulator n=1 Tax=Agromyces mediolanus TaxID=41986 RepID=UPI00203E0BB1|nr:TetR/AcrR family transcriptional regulator C-terminal domain-containing protein [Agromyces mediolanus]MCM3657875.1 TetR/AcrR family transcriptional regulator C-terminal domain-containing protein [Agromyces mediolanus]
MPRPRIPLLSEDRIADAAIELVDSGDPFGVNALARRLGVTPSSLYNHVDGRDGIIELMRGRLGRRYLPELPEGAWDEVVAETLRGMRRLYAGHPAVVPLLVGKTITDPSVIASYDGLTTALIDGGFPDDEVLAVVAVLDSFALGFGLDLASPDDIWQPQGETRTLGRLLGSAERGSTRSERAFELGLELLLESLRLRLARISAR